MDGRFEAGMTIALEEARRSLREGNNGFGAVILQDGGIVAQAHDTEESKQDPTAHAETSAIRQAAARIGKDLSDCVLLSTHEPCPMCATAIVWAGIPHIGYGYSIREAAEQGRRRMNLPVEELFRRAGVDIRVEHGLLWEECAVLYDAAVRGEIKKLRTASDEELTAHNERLASKRLQWYESEGRSLSRGDGDPLENGYRLLLHKLGIRETTAPVVNRTERRLVFHSENFCPTLEACKILQLNTRRVCRLCNEGATDQLLRQIHPKLRFGRNYERIRPYSDSCEEWIELVP